MIKFTTGPERKYMMFKSEVLKSFRFLIQDYHFECVETNDTFVRYESESLFVNVYHGRGSYELGFEIGRIQGDPKMQRKFTLREIIKLCEAEKESGYTFFQASTQERVVQLVPRLAQLVQKYARPALAGEDSFFKRLEELRDRESAAFLEEMKLENVRTKAKQAWQQKDYSEVVRLLSSVNDKLTASEQKKLKYAQKKI